MTPANLPSAPDDDPTGTATTPRRTTDISAADTADTAGAASTASAADPFTDAVGSNAAASNGNDENEPAVEISGLVKRYTPRKGEPTTAVDGLAPHVPHRRTHRLLGPNGAGKTTTIETLVRPRTPTARTARVLGIDPPAPTPP